MNRVMLHLLIIMMAGQQIFAFVPKILETNAISRISDINNISNIKLSLIHRKVAKTSLAAKGKGGDAASRRRRRKVAKKDEEDSTSSYSDRVITSSTPTSIDQLPSSSSIPTKTSNSPTTSLTSTTNSNLVDSNSIDSIEANFGLDNQQLRELMEQELPVPREDLVTGKELEVDKANEDKVFQLPDLNEYLAETTTEEAIKRQKEREAALSVKVDRSDMNEYGRVLALNPFADADEDMFQEEYDVLQAIFGSGKLLYIPVPYLQTGHAILLIVAFLAANLYIPGNPLTEFPLEIREFLRSGLLVIMGINFVLAGLAWKIATEKNLPGLFWAIKCFFVGGISFYEITQAKDPTKLNPRDPFDGRDPSDRKSKTSTSK